MNRTARTVLRSFVLAAALAGPGVAAADDNLSRQVVTGVGRIIAAQGNAALVQIREELRETLERNLEPLLPQDDVATPAAAPAREVAVRGLSL